MTKSPASKPIRVSADGTAGPYIMVPVTELDAVRRVLDANRVRYWVDDDAISLDGAPEIVVVNFGRGTDPTAVQSMLDARA